jgi:hypothetical protein
MGPRGVGFNWVLGVLGVYSGYSIQLGVVVPPWILLLWKPTFPFYFTIPSCQIRTRRRLSCVPYELNSCTAQISHVPLLHYHDSHLYLFSTIHFRALETVDKTFDFCFSFILPQDGVSPEHHTKQSLNLLFFMAGKLSHQKCSTQKNCFFSIHQRCPVSLFRSLSNRDGFRRAISPMATT